jgi:hypothetical protein
MGRDECNYAGERGKRIAMVVSGVIVVVAGVVVGGGWGRRLIWR